MKVKMNANGIVERDANGRAIVDYNGSNITFGAAGLTYDEMDKTHGRDWQKREMGWNATLRREDIQHIEEKMFAPIQADLQARALVGNITDAPAATEQWQYDKWTHMNAAEFVGRKGRRPRDEVGQSRTSVTMLETSKGWSLSRRDLLAEHTDIQAINMASALMQCREKENGYIIQSADYPDVDGLIDDAGNTDAASNAWSTAAGTRLPYEDCNTGVGTMRADGFNGIRKAGYYPDQYTELHGRDTSAGGGGVTYASLVVPGLFSEVLMTPGGVDATGLIVDQTPGVCTLVRAEEFKVRIFEMDKDHQIAGDVTGVTSVAVMQPNGVCSQTSL